MILIFLGLFFLAGCKTTDSKTASGISVSNGPSFEVRSASLILRPNSYPQVVFTVDSGEITESDLPAGSPNAITVYFLEDTNGVMLKIQNGYDSQLHVSARMKLPHQSVFRDTSILPVFPGISGYETWPHDIEILELHSFALSNED